MKLNFGRIIGASAASVLAFAALGDDTPKLKTDRPTHSSDRLPNGRRSHRLNDAAKASDLIGMAVRNYQDEKLGKVDEVAVDLESGRVLQVIVATGGFIGLGDRLSAVPPGALHHDVAKKVLHLNVDKEKLKGAPEFEMTRWPDYSDSEHLTEVYRYYGEESSLSFIIKNDAVLDTRPRTDTDRTLGESPFMIPASRLSQVQRASKLIGTAVQNLQEEKLGKVENLLIDLPSGRVVAVVVSSGGFLGMGDELSAVPPSALRFTSDRHTLQLDTTKEMLSAAPHFKAHQWPDFAEQTYTEGVYHAYRVQPYFANQDADNTARNTRDRNNNALTPLDQGKSESDRKTTAEVRKAVIAEKGLSVNARNVKIITVNGQVTLRGPVNTTEERTRIADIASRIAGSANVNSQLEVKSKADATGN